MCSRRLGSQIPDRGRVAVMVALDRRMTVYEEAIADRRELERNDDSDNMENSRDSRYTLRRFARHRRGCMTSAVVRG